MFNKIWMWYWQRVADKHFYKGLKNGFVTINGQSELNKYFDCIDKKFHR